MTWQTLLARLRLPLLLAGLAVLLLGDRLGLPPILVVALFLASYFAAARLGTVHREPAVVHPPVAGRWVAVHSPATRVPSHGIQVYGQSHAIDLVHEPAPGARPPTRWWPLSLGPEAFPAFGQPILAATSGTVIRAHDRERDHRSRTSWPAMLYLVLEGVLRELTGPGRILGNHLIVRNDDGTYAAYAHLRRGSLRVAKGQRVTAGQHIADCGNSGNSSEPHLHFQLMDHRNVLVAAGLPMLFALDGRGPGSPGRDRSDGADEDGDAHPLRTVMPANGEALDVPAAATS